jgi:hypothetical protein
VSQFGQGGGHSVERSLPQSPMVTSSRITEMGRRMSNRKKLLGVQARKPRNNVLLVAAFAFAACTGSTSARPQAAPSHSGRTSPSPSATACLSPDRPGSIRCDEAIRRAWAYGASIPSRVTAMLRTVPFGTPRRPVLAWTVTFHDAEIELDGPRGGCIRGDWEVVINAGDGSFLFGGTWDGPRSPC